LFICSQFVIANIGGTTSENSKMKFQKKKMHNNKLTAFKAVYSIIKGAKQSKNMQ